MGRRFLAGLCLLAAVSAGTAAHAQEACLQLETQLAALERGGLDQEYARLSEQLTRETATYDAAYRDAEARGCMTLFRRNAPAGCEATLVWLDGQQQALRALSERVQAADPSQAGTIRTNLLRALAANNCGAQYAAYATAAPQQGGRLLDRLFGNPDAAPAPAPVPSLVTTYRTVCVRTCDGSFFPISFSTTPAQFAADARSCAQACPGAAVDLYYYRNPGGDLGQAVNLSGAAYQALANAFAYQTSFNPSCTCHSATTAPPTDAPAGGFTPLGQEAADLIAELRAVVPLPVPRPEPSEDPDTLANRAGGYAPGNRVVPVFADAAVRLIGPAYYYAR